MKFRILRIVGQVHAARRGFWEITWSAEVSALHSSDDAFTDTRDGDIPQRNLS